MATGGLRPQQKSRASQETEEQGRRDNTPRCTWAVGVGCSGGTEGSHRLTLGTPQRRPGGDVPELTVQAPAAAVLAEQEARGFQEAEAQRTGKG